PLLPEPAAGPGGDSGTGHLATGPNTLPLPGAGNLPGTPPGVGAAAPGYEFIADVGHGGMGVVYRARDRALGRDVAVKTLQRKFAAAGPAARRFTAEARITGQLQHPGIPAVYQVGASPDGRPFLVMRLIIGRTLAELLKERPGPAHDRARFLAIFQQVCEA